MSRHDVYSTSKHPASARAADRVRRVACAGLILTALSPVVWAKPITQTAIALGDTPRYVDAVAFPYANPAAPKGGTLSRQALGTFDSFNPFIDKGQSVIGTDYLFDSLTTASLDEPFARYPLLAERITSDPQDGSWIIYHLNPRARFHSGLPVRADDVVFTFETLLKEGTPGLRSYLGDIRAVQALDPLTVKFTFKRADNPEIALTVGEVSILSRADWAGRPFNQVSLRVPVGSGPYRVEQVDHGRAITYRRDPDYWGRDLMANRGKYNFDRIRYVYYRSGEVAFEGFKSGQYRLREENKARNWAVNYDFPAVRQGLVKKELIRHQNPVAMQALVFNLRKPRFQDLRVRQALTLAFDFEWMNKAIFNGGYERLQSYWHNSELAATGSPSADEQKLLAPLLPQLSPAEQQAVLTPWRAPVSDGSGFNRANLLKARELLLAAGYRYQHGQLVDAKGQPFTLELLSYDESLQRVLLPLVRNLKRLGIDARVRMVDTPQYIERGRRFDYDMVIDQFPQSLSPGNEQLGYWSSAAAREPGSQNSIGIQSPVVDALLQSLVRKQSRASLLTATHALDRVLRAGYYAIPMYGVPAYRVAYWAEYRHPERRPFYALGLDYWWSDAATAAQSDRYIQGGR